MPRRLPYAPTSECRVCGAEIDVHQAIFQEGTCAKPACQLEELGRRQAETRAIERRRREVAAAHLGPDAGSWSLTPANRAEPVPLSRERRTDFVRWVESLVEGGEVGEAARTPALGRADPDGFGRPGREEAAALAEGCAACRGRCCRRGGTHAFLTADHVAGVLEARPELGEDGVVRLYASFLPERHLEGGCVYQGETGCTLDPELRSPTCHRYFCEDLVSARRAWRRGSSGRTHVFVAVDPGDDAPAAVRETGRPEVGQPT